MGSTQVENPDEVGRIEDAGCCSRRSVGINDGWRGVRGGGGRWRSSVAGLFAGRRLFQENPALQRCQAKMGEHSLLRRTTHTADPRRG